MEPERVLSGRLSKIYSALAFTGSGKILVFFFSTKFLSLYRASTWVLSAWSHSARQWQLPSPRIRGIEYTSCLYFSVVSPSRRQRALTIRAMQRTVWLRRGLVNSVFPQSQHWDEMWRRWEPERFYLGHLSKFTHCPHSPDRIQYVFSAESPSVEHRLSLPLLEDRGFDISVPKPQSNIELPVPKRFNDLCIFLNICLTKDVRKKSL